ncbi:MAG TPA: MTH1187 family thiamine-binding protein [Bacteroidales bacterium]|nr:MTH1187 family thiamine-binding protein [Bacteroidales bacterium]
MNHQVNVAVQVLPRSKSQKTYALVDQAIKVINDSGLRYRVCPFETVIEGPYQDIMKVVEKLQEVCFEKGADEMLIYLKIQNRKDGKVTIEDKMEKYD